MEKKAPTGKLALAKEYQPIPVPQPIVESQFVILAAVVIAVGIAFGGYLARPDDHSYAVIEQAQSNLVDAENGQRDAAMSYGQMLASDTEHETELAECESELPNSKRLDEFKTKPKSKISGPIASAPPTLDNVAPGTVNGL